MLLEVLIALLFTSPSIHEILYKTRALDIKHIIWPIYVAWRYVFSMRAIVNYFHRYFRTKVTNCKLIYLYNCRNEQFIKPTLSMHIFLIHEVTHDMRAHHMQRCYLTPPGHVSRQQINNRTYIRPSISIQQSHNLFTVKYFPSK